MSDKIIAPAQNTVSSTQSPAFLERPDGQRIAYIKTEGDKDLPGLVFLGGFMSDMTGTKAVALENFARDSGQSFLRFDYAGHGQSSGLFKDGTIGQWSQDALAALDHLTEGPQILVGSSMGGWIMLNVALQRPGRIQGLVGIAAAPDFTEDLMWQQFSPEIKQTLLQDGVYHQPSDYGDAPYPLTLNLIEEGRNHLLLRQTQKISCPVRLIQGIEDLDVPWITATRISESLQSDDVEIILVKNGDHRLSTPHDLHRLFKIVKELSHKKL
ncbi:alpha/beta hydrolase [Kiloniella laminariae]|uniref:Palmitoyl-protein thioesterase ABHD10, mitochondrial n=1 Tax=Kiloniella laminariae TaxID=454162 RepID=A0ABT4LKB5_9PROT|nr:alpha/beta hydrolase [Kiloniella laminariae]MCZ4281553.1 alpha/beta hydrolase [Kiloniella laminariae]